MTTATDKQTITPMNVIEFITYAQENGWAIVKEAPFPSHTYITALTTSGRIIVADFSKEGLLITIEGK